MAKAEKALRGSKHLVRRCTFGYKAVLTAAMYSKLHKQNLNKKYFIEAMALNFTFSMSRKWNEGCKTKMFRKTVT